MNIVESLSMNSVFKLSLFTLAMLGLTACKTTDTSLSESSDSNNVSIYTNKAGMPKTAPQNTVVNPRLAKRPADPFTPPATPPSPYNLDAEILLKNDWQLVRIDDRAGKNIYPSQLKNLKPLRLSFDNAERFFVSNSCNNMNVNYHLQQGKLTVLNIMSTRKACETPLMTLEGIASKALRGEYLFVLDSQSKTQLLVQNQEYSLLFNPVSKKTVEPAKDESKPSVNKTAQTAKVKQVQNPTATSTKTTSPAKAVDKTAKTEQADKKLKTSSKTTTATVTKATTTQSQKTATTKTETVKSVATVPAVTTQIVQKPAVATTPATPVPLKPAVTMQIVQKPEVTTDAPVTDAKASETSPLATVKSKLENLKDKITGKADKSQDVAKPTPATPSVEKPTATTKMPSSALTVVDAPDSLPPLDPDVKPINIKSE